MRSFQCINEERSHIATCLVEDLLKAGGAGDIDLGDAVANDVHARQQQATRSCRMGPRAFTNLLVALLTGGRATPLPPAARLPRTSVPCGNARQAITAPACRRSPAHACRPRTISGKNFCTITLSRAVACSASR